MTLIEMDFFPSNFMVQTPPHPHPHQESDQQQHHHHHQELPTSLPHLIPSCSSQHFYGVASLLGKRSSMTFSGIDVFEETTINAGDDEFSDDGSQIGEKKRRLNMEQVKTLEKNFELGNKLDPERKMQLARALGLQPRQIAVWFQNRRARWKTKQLEKDYDVLKTQFHAVKLQNHALQAQNLKLQAEIMAINNKEATDESINLNIINETEGSSSNNRSEENSSDNNNIKVDISRTTFPIRPSNNEQLFQTSSMPELQFQKIDQIGKEESLISNMLCNIDEQTAFWPWLEPQHFN